MEDEYLYQRIQEALENIPENFYVLEEQINVELQQEYFRLSGKLREGKSLQKWLEGKEKLYDAHIKAATKRKILAALGASGEVESFRTLEKYLNNPDPELKDWAVLALQEARMILQSALLDEQQVYISTGLGGKGKNLRYFAVFLNREGNGLTPMQSKLLQDEIRYGMEKNDGNLEEFNQMLDFTTAMVMLPLKAPLKDIFKGIIDECNQYGNFLKEDFLITNVKRLNPVEIVELLKQQGENRKTAGLRKNESDAGEESEE